MKKSILMFVSIILIILFTCSCEGIFIGDGWQDTPEKALAIAKEDAVLDDESVYSVANLLDSWDIDDKAYMLYISEADTLVEAFFVKNEKGQYHFQGYSEEVEFNSPDSFILNGDSEQFVLSAYNKEGTYVWGYKFSSVDITVNGIAPKIETYTFSAQGKEWSIDRWYLDGVNENDEINIKIVKN